MPLHCTFSSTSAGAQEKTLLSMLVKCQCCFIVYLLKTNQEGDAVGFGLEGALLANQGFRSKREGFGCKFVAVREKASCFSSFNKHPCDHSMQSGFCEATCGLNLCTWILNFCATLGGRGRICMMVDLGGSQITVHHILPTYLENSDIYSWGLQVPSPFTKRRICIFHCNIQLYALLQIRIFSPIYCTPNLHFPYEKRFCHPAQQFLVTWEQRSLD